MKYKKKFSRSEKILELVRIGLENTYTRGVFKTHLNPQYQTRKS